VTGDNHERFAVTHVAALCAYFRKRGVSPPDVDDLVQETVAIGLALHDRIQPGKEAAFLFGIARHVLLAHRRTLKRDSRTLSSESPRETGDAPVESPYFRVLARENGQRLRQAIEGLPSGQREVVRLVYMEGLTKAEAARRMNLSEKTVHTHHTRALKRLRAILVSREG
jgi:RNA polymerase sigma factor (sigma-70 family)